MELYRLLYIRELNSHVNDCPGGNLIWARMSGVVIWCEHECPGWSFDVSTNARGGHFMWARMSGPVKNRVGTNVRGNECPYTINTVKNIFPISFRTWTVLHYFSKKSFLFCWQCCKFQNLMQKCEFNLTIILWTCFWVLSWCCNHKYVKSISPVWLLLLLNP